uniref:Uncharacterized protein n=1 Tax=Arundo donax TaxID=35708 RepID=A0A0A8ZDE4_ARUDO
METCTIFTFPRI